MSPPRRWLLLLLLAACTAATAAVPVPAPSQPPKSLSYRYEDRLLATWRMTPATPVSLNITMPLRLPELPVLQVAYLHASPAPRPVSSGSHSLDDGVACRVSAHYHAPGSLLPASWSLSKPDRFSLDLQGGAVPVALSAECSSNALLSLEVFFTSRNSHTPAFTPDVKPKAAVPRLPSAFHGVVQDIHVPNDRTDDDDVSSRDEAAADAEPRDRTYRVALLAHLGVLDTLQLVHDSEDAAVSELLAWSDGDDDTAVIASLYRMPDRMVYRRDDRREPHQCTAEPLADAPAPLFGHVDMPDTAVEDKHISRVPEQCQHVAGWCRMWRNTPNLESWCFGPHFIVYQRPGLLRCALSLDRSAVTPLSHASLCGEGVCLRDSCGEWGICHGEGECRCMLPRAFIGPACRQSPLCGTCVHGVCQPGDGVQPPHCLCDAGWHGAMCNIPSCHDGCEFPGQMCTSLDTCSACMPGRAGYPQCDQPQCAPGMCNDGTVCVGRNQCACPPLWRDSGSRVERCLPPRHNETLVVPPRGAARFNDPIALQLAAGLVTMHAPDVFHIRLPDLVFADERVRVVNMTTGSRGAAALLQHGRIPQWNDHVLDSDPLSSWRLSAHTPSYVSVVSTATQYPSVQQPYDLQLVVVYEDATDIPVNQPTRAELIVMVLGAAAVLILTFIVLERTQSRTYLPPDLADPLHVNDDVVSW